VFYPFLICMALFPKPSNQVGLNTLVHITIFVCTGILSEFLSEMFEFKTKLEALIFTEVHYVLCCMHY